MQTRAVTPELLTSGSIGVFLEGPGPEPVMTKKTIYSMIYNVGWKPKTETIYLGGEDADVMCL